MTTLYEHYRITADKGQTPLRADKFLASRLPGIARHRIQLAAAAGCILVNGKPQKSNYRVKPLDTLTVLMTRPPRDTQIQPENIPLALLYEDDDLMVINKPPGLVVHPGCGNNNGTLLNALAWRLKDMPDWDTTDPRFGLVHRLDKDTSGLLVVAKNPTAKSRLGKQFYRKSATRTYHALVWGHLPENEGRIEGHIGRHPRNRQQMTVFPDGDKGKPAITHYRVLERFAYVTLAECTLETGRTHQIRAHMKHIGHPLFNDARYGGNQILKGNTSTHYRQFIHNCFALCPRQALHAKTLHFTHPTTDQPLHFDTPLPDDMQQLIQKWRIFGATPGWRNW